MNVILFVFGIINAFTDVVSWFGCSLCQVVAVVDAFIEMALDFGFNGVVLSLITVLILVVGHLFNIVLSGFGILVHGLRLTVLEFSDIWGWNGGVKYAPFKLEGKL